MRESLRTLPGRLTAAIVGVAIRHAWLALLLALIGTGFALHYTVEHIAIDTDTSDMIDPNLPHRRAYRDFESAFPHLPGDIVVFTEARYAGAADDAADALAEILRKRPDVARGVIQPGGGDFFATHGLLYLSVDELWDLDARLHAAEPFLGTLAHDPSLRGLFTTLQRGLDDTLDPEQQRLLARMLDRISGALESRLAGKPEPVHWRDELFARNTRPDRLHRAFVLVDPALDPTDFQPEAPALDALRALIPTFEAAHPEVRVRLTGSSVMNDEELVTVANDAKLTTVLSFLCVAVVLILGLRTPLLVVAVLVTLACGLITTAAFATAAVGALNIISACFAVLFIGMGVDFGIQFSMRYLEEADNGQERNTALVAAGRGAGGALALAAAGAGISFLAFVPTHYLGLAQLGIVSGFSMIVAWFLNITLLPALLSRIPTPKRRAFTASLPEDGPSWAQRHRRPILAITALAVLGGLAALPFAHFDLNPLNLKDSSTEGVAAFRDLASDPDSTPYTIQALAPSLDAAVALAKRLGQLPTVDKAITLASFVPDDQDEKLEIIDGLRTALDGVLEPATGAAPSLAEERAAITAFATTLRAHATDSSVPEWSASRARLLAALDASAARADWPQEAIPALRGLLLGDLDMTLRRLARLLEAESVTLDTLPQDLRAQYVAADGRARIQLVPKADLNTDGAMRDFVLDVQGVTPTATDAPVELYGGSQTVISACITASAWALLLTILMHVFVLHGVVDALLIAAPLVLAMLLTIATSVVFKVPFNFANVIALPLLIGLNNAYGAYLVVRNNAAAGISAVLQSSTPRAVLFSGLTTLSSFGVLGISRHPGMAGLGILISVSLSYAILSALIVLPAMIATREHWSSARKGAV